MTTKPVCPRCGELIPNNLQPGAYPGALSRTDNKTEICSECGTIEALEDNFGSLAPQSEWVASGNTIR
jgi:ribosomal protein S27AE